MPTKILTSPRDNKGNLKDFSFGGGSNTNIALIDPLFPDDGYSISSGGGDDTVIGSSNDDIITGGAGSDSITGGLGNDTIFGGAADGSDSTKGKGNALSNVLIGDESNVGGGVVGDPVIVCTYTGGNDTIVGGNGGNNSIYGDNLGTVVLATGQAFVGGNDNLTGGSGAAGESVFNTLIGDSQSVFSSGTSTFSGGDDVLTGGSGVDFISVGGSAIFFVNNTLVGDVRSNGGTNTTFIGGDDTLISGAFAADTMTGDFVDGSAGSVTGGNDTFVFAANNGADTITDFHQGEDVINLSGTGLTFLDLDSDSSGTLDNSDDHISIVGGNTVIDLGEAAGGSAGVHTVRVSNVIDMNGADFDFDVLIV